MHDYIYLITFIPRNITSQLQCTVTQTIEKRIIVAETCEKLIIVAETCEKFIIVAENCA